MKKLMVSTFALLLVVGCANTNERSIASTSSSNCWLKKHDSKDYFKVMHNDNPLYEHWYDEDYAKGLLERSASKGKCQ